ncbi:hypothetical protein JB92DRAFT_3132945 [Gautieria morchelliformis]|nr:hypothetical protein JB92DRAFT_3132945 [Gautieria morchelliformis]
MPPESLTLTISERVRFVYQEVWHEFFDWEQEYCVQMLTSLDPTTSAITPHPVLSLEVSETVEIATGDASSIATDCIQLWHFDSNMDVSSEVLSCPTYSCTSLEPVKPYEACTYSHKNLYVADDFCEKLQFMPFSDDLRFPAAELFELYDSIGWETRKDPDLDVIVAEAARRLHFRFGISFADIDETGVLPISIIERPERKGLLRMLSQRDMLLWPGSFLSDLPVLPKTDDPPLTALRKRVNGIRYLFCANLNCLEPYCPTHRVVNLDEQLKPPTNNEVQGNSEHAGNPPCGYDCFKYLSDQTEGLTFWDDTEIGDFKFILEGAAELSSCDLAVALEVKEGAFGLGLFLLEPAVAGDLIGGANPKSLVTIIYLQCPLYPEYVGEILNDKMTDARGVQTRHLGRNYLFGLNAEWTIDAALVGNETRFINHAQRGLANCRAEVREVNGDHRIYALKKAIHPGEELFMDYGEEYFTSGVTGGTPRARGKT